jgi:hypothetical protein
MGCENILEFPARRDLWDKVSHKVKLTLPGIRYMRIRQGLETSAKKDVKYQPGRSSQGRFYRCFRHSHVPSAINYSGFLVHLTLPAGIPAHTRCTLMDVFAVTAR